MGTDWETQVKFTKSELETLDEVLRGWKLRWDQTTEAYIRRCVTTCRRR